MTKKGIKKSSTTEVKCGKRAKSTGKRKLFDENGKLIVSNTPNLEEQRDAIAEHTEQADHKATGKVGKESPLTDAERQEKKRQYWRGYYSKNREKYKRFNKNWREKQKTKKSEEKTKK
jgi:hypothetical protein